MKIYNTLTRKKEAFKPLKYPEVKLYQCGPTVYNNAHIGNLKTSVIEDVVARSLDFLGYQVSVTMNITDIDDKTIRDSQKEGQTLKDFTERYTDIFFEDLEKLRCKVPDIVEPISNIIPEMVRMIQTMINRGFAYLAEDGSIYFDISKSKNYGKLANLDFSGMKSSVRIDNDEYDKDNAADFVLWKAWKEEDGDNFWEEAFIIPSETKLASQASQGQQVLIKGRPGWHIECSACAMKHFGKQIDIHMGGEDLVFPHHQNEIAQTEACTGKEFSKYWIHSGHLMVEGKKMSKSLKNFYTLADIESNFPSEKRLFRAVRMGFINGRYREQIDFSFAKLEQNINALKNIDELCKRLIRYEPEFSGVRPEFRDYLQEVSVRYIEALEDDFAFPEVFAVLFEFTKYISSDLVSKDMTSDELLSCVDMLMSFDEVLQILDRNIFEESEEGIPEDILAKAQARDEAKLAKDYSLADSLRDEIIALGYVVKDTQEGTVIEIN